MDKCNFQRTCQPPIGAMNNQMYKASVSCRDTLLEKVTN